MTGIAHAQPVDTAEKAAHAGHAIFLPVKIAVRRRGEQGIGPRGVRPKARNHLVGRDHIALRLGHLGAVSNHHSLAEEPLHRLVVAINPRSRITLVQKRE